MSNTIPIATIRLEKITFAYRGSAKPIFENLTMDFPTDKNILITGSSGQGSSTLLKLLAVVHQPQSGSVLIDGLDTSQMSFEEFLPLRKKIGYTFDYGGLFANASLLENLTLPLLYHKVCSFEEARARGTEIAAHFGFMGKLSERPASVTGGLRKLVSVLRTLMTNPEMLVMDDPFMGVDPHSVGHLIKILNERKESGEIRHLFLTSRDVHWPKELGCSTLRLQNGPFANAEAA